MSLVLTAKNAERAEQQAASAIRECYGDAFTRVLENLLNPSDNAGPGKGIDKSG
jgi:hypothetical protein